MSYLCPICKLHHYSGDYPCEPGDDTLHPDATLTFDEDGLNLLQAFASAAIHVDVWKRKTGHVGPQFAMGLAQHEILEKQDSRDPYQVIYAACLKTAFGQ